jgi:AcrR family transcriptional regulator
VTDGHNEEALMGREERRHREREARKNAILKAARKLAFEKGFKSATVDSIAKKAELSKGTIYLYFNSKEDIYFQILLKEIDKFHSFLSDIFDCGGAATDMLKKFSDVYTDAFVKDRELFRIFTVFLLHTNEMNFTEEIANQLLAATLATANIIEKVFKHGIERGEFSEQINVKQLKNVIWGLLNGIISLHLFTGKESTRAERIQSTVNESLDVFLRGISRTALKENTPTGCPGEKLSTYS